MPSKFKKFFLSLIILEMLLSYAPAFAQTATYNGDYSTAGVSTEIEKYLCSPVGGGSGVLYKCINQLYKFAIVLASVIGVFFIVIAGYIYMSADGNSEATDKAKSILESTIASIVILLAGYVLLNAINPDLIQFHSVQPPSVTNIQVGTAGVPAQSTNQGTIPSDVTTAASSLLSLNGSKISIASSGCDCPNNCAINTLQTLASGKQAQFDGPGTTCAAGYTSVSPQMLTALTSIANSGTSYTINSITGGHHISANDTHYQGRAVDLGPSPLNSASAQQTLITALQNNGATTVAIECVYGGAGVYWPVPAQAQANDTRCLGQTNYHIHAQW